MAAPASASQPPPVGPDTLISVKVLFEGFTRRFKLPLRDMGPYSLPLKIRQLLAIPDNADITIERYSDSASSYVVLNTENPTVYKQLYRAAKAKLKLRIKVSVAQVPEAQMPPPPPPQNEDIQQEQPQQRHSYLDTVLRLPVTEFMDQADYPPAAPAPSTLNASMFPNVPEESPVEDDNNQPEQQQEFISPMQPPTFICSGAPRFAQATSICIDCNNCGNPVPDAHYHCSICDDGDYDLCQRCIDAGVLCPGEGHWLIKRTVNDGRVTNSITETIAPRKIAEPEPQEEVSSEEHATPMEEDDETKLGERTCNACFRDFSEKELVSCKNCPDYDLCLTCLLEGRHGHHPGHEFSLLVDGEFHSKSLVEATCLPGRGRYHAAICDGCNKSIRGVRHKCLNCPDWDYCSECIKSASEFHPGHRFAPLYDPIPEPHGYRQTHYGVICDGPLCSVPSKMSYIRGTRYKCAVCHDTDFCSNCEAHPDNTHNRTHPLIKFKTPVRNATITTFADNGDRGENAIPLGDRPTTKSTSTETEAPSKSNAATQVQSEKAVSEPVNQKDVATVQPDVQEPPKKTDTEPRSAPSDDLQALFVRDTLPDGSNQPPGKVITQTWTLYNPGPTPWPKGCSVRFVGGDSMFNVDIDHPSSVNNLISAMESQELPVPVPPCGSADFTVTLKTPPREGKAISYWRLKTPDGLAFGHKLWCDVNVRSSIKDSETLPQQAADSKQPSVETEVPSVDSSTEVGDAEAPHEPQSESAMIFPKLETESSTESCQKASSPPVIIATKASPASQDLVDDVESLTLDETSTEDDFLTDEEYDILDASDQEFSSEAQKQEKK